MVVECINNMFVSNKKRDASWLARSSSDEKKKMIERIVDKSNQDQREVIDEYKQARSN